ncbi:MAG: ABC transporter permease [Armatimonadetes bacterium]|nr:ABC transporter permease [Armatimonadota bacterium]
MGKLEPPAGEGRRPGAWRRFLRHRNAVGGTVVILLFGVGALVAPLLTPYGPIRVDLLATSQPPGPGHPLGTDDLGRDLWSRILYGGRYALGLSLLTALLAGAVGTGVGVVSGYNGGWIDGVVMRVVDILLAFPTFLLGLALMAVVGPSVGNVVAVLAFTRMPRYARLLRGSTLTLRNAEYVTAAQAMGASGTRVVFRHILPNCVAPATVFMSLDLGGIVTSLAGLSFLGVGIQPPAPDWGVMLTDARKFIYTAPWIALFPGLAITLTVMAFNFVGDGVRDALDPRLRSQM